MKKKLTVNEMRDIWIYVLQSKHGDFLTDFAKAFCHADYENVELLYKASRKLIKKYNLPLKVSNL